MNSETTKILSVVQAQSEVVIRPNYWNVISIGSKDEGWPVLQLSKSIQRLKFSDIELYSDTDLNDRLLKRGCVLPTWEEIKLALDFSFKCGNEPLIIHCQAGVSRSSAVCLLCLYQQFNCMERSLTELARIKDFDLILPNKYVLHLGLEKLCKTDSEYAFAFDKFHDAFKTRGMWMDK